MLYDRLTCLPYKLEAEQMQRLCFCKMSSTEVGEQCYGFIDDASEVLRREVPVRLSVAQSQEQLEPHTVKMETITVATAPR